MPRKTRHDPFRELVLGPIDPDVRELRDRADQQRQERDAWIRKNVGDPDRPLTWPDRGPDGQWVERSLDWKAAAALRIRERRRGLRAWHASVQQRALTGIEKRRLKKAKNDRTAKLKEDRRKKIEAWGKKQLKAAAGAVPFESMNEVVSTLANDTDLDLDLSERRVRDYVKFLPAGLVPKTRRRSRPK